MNKKSIEDVKSDFLKKGITVASFCKENDLPRHVVSDLLRKKCVGRRGKSHQAAVLLGLKEGA